VIPLFEQLHPGAIGLFTFDQSSNHCAMAEDSLQASKMNLNPGGKVPKMKNGWYIKDGERIIQQMQNEEGIPKGIRAILAERGLWPTNGIRLDCNGQCSDNCCARRIMANQPDFLEQKSQISEKITNAGHFVDYYPKFHCECNYIERFWGAAKRQVRRDCDYSFASLKSRVPQTMKSISLETIRKFSRKSWRYIHAYSKGLNGEVAAWAVKKFKSHRKISEEIEKIIEEYNNH